MDYSLLGSSVHRILRARILEWIAMPSSRDLPNPETGPASPALAGTFFYCSLVVAQTALLPQALQPNTLILHGIPESVSGVLVCLLWF